MSTNSYYDDDSDNTDPVGGPYDYLQLEEERGHARAREAHFYRARSTDDVLHHARMLMQAGSVGSSQAYGHEHNVYRIADGLAAIERVEPTLVRDAAALFLDDFVSNAFELGRDPAELAHIVGRALSPEHMKLVVAGIFRHAHANNAEADGPHAWCAQLDAIDDRWRVDPEQYRSALSGGPYNSLTRLNWRVFLEAVRFLGALRAVDPAGRIPSEWTSAHSDVSGDNADDRMLAKIRGLLAKAESSTYEHESDALFEKAQALMTRYSIDSALMDSESSRSLHEDVATRRILIGYPYAKSKVYLLNEVCKANSVKSVWAQWEGLSTLVGMPVDLDLCEMLFTSLLVQSFQAMTAAGADDRLKRTGAFRRSFLISYSDRIGERLGQVKTQAQNDAAVETGKDLVPVLTARSDAVESIFTMRFPKLGTMTTSISNMDGYVAGRVAADFADLTTAGRVDPGQKPVLP